MKNYLEYFEQLVLAPEARVKLVEQFHEKVQEEFPNLYLRNNADRTSVALFYFDKVLKRKANEIRNEIKTYTYSLSEREKISVFINQIIRTLKVFIEDHGKVR